MQQIYYNPKHVGSFGGVNALAKQTNGNVKQWLQSQDTYTLHKPVKRKYNRRRIFVPGLNHVWQMDLVDLQFISRYNDGFKFLLTCIDCFSRYAFVRPLKNKTAISVRDAVNDIFHNRRPAYIQTDKGREFVNAIFQDFLKQNNIQFYTTENSDIKCAMVERFNRTLKEKMWRYFTYKNTSKYIDVLQDLVTSYNNSHHRSIKTAPALVTASNEQEVYDVQYSKPNEKYKYKFDIGDKVRISETRQVFDKGYRGHWTTELFVVRELIPTSPPTYELNDLGGEAISGRFYAEELQKVLKTDDTFKISKILKTRKRGGKVEYFVRWEGYSPKFDSWVDSVTRL